MRSVRVFMAQNLRPRTIAVFITLTILSVVLLLAARDIPDYAANLALNLGAELIGAVLILFAVTPIVRRVQQGRVIEHRELDYNWYLDRVLGATRLVRVLDTFSSLFTRPFDQRFYRITTALLQRGASVQVLLMDPDSLAAEQRTAELQGRGDVRMEILGNIRRLDAYRQSLDPHLRQFLEVRLYAASASVTIYRWDSRMLVSFLPLGRLSGGTTQLEVSSDSPLGNFVGERFDDLWSHGTSIADHLALRITVTDTAGSRDYESRYVVLDGERYLADPHVIAHLARHREGTLTARLTNAPSRVHELLIVDEESTISSELHASYLAKYERPGAAFVWLVAAHTTRSDPR